MEVVDDVDVVVVVDENVVVKDVVGVEEVEVEVNVVVGNERVEVEEVRPRHLDLASF